MAEPRRMLWRIGLLAALGGLVWWAWPRGATGSALNHDENGLWMRRTWLHAAGEKDLPRLVRELDEAGITRIYPFLGPPDAEGWPGWRSEGEIQRVDHARAAAFLREMKALAPHVQVVPWTGGVLHRDVFPAELSHRRAFAAQLARLTEAGADGVQLNVEPMPEQTPGYLELLQDVRAAIGPGKVLSVAAYPPTTELHPFPDVHWSLAFTREVCLQADELAVMAYDTALRSEYAYRSLVTRWTQDLAATLPPPEEGGCSFLIGVPAYEDDEGWHRPDIETLETGIQGVLRAFPEGAPAHFRGLAIYASWTMDAAEWGAWSRLWTGRETAGVTDPAD
ncbi:MAG: hypothetical protein H6740_27965 [Alphaproteobacteria bacterium]|nr:hypothetical protein [Alphaproteobacteria bacterium]